MTKEKELEKIIRLSPVGGHVDVRRRITDAPVGYLHGSNIAVANFIDVSSKSSTLPLGQHFHMNYGEIFGIGTGGGTLYLRAVVPGETNRINEEIVVPREIPQYSLPKELYGVEIELRVDSEDPEKRFVRVSPGIAHTFVLSPESLLIPFIVDAPKDFDPHNKENYVSFPLI